jgi:hypothetical protein
MTMSSAVVTDTHIQITQHGDGPPGLVEPGTVLSGGGGSASAAPLLPAESVAVP